MDKLRIWEVITNSRDSSDAVKRLIQTQDQIFTYANDIIGKIVPYVSHGRIDTASVLRYLLKIAMEHTDQAYTDELYDMTDTVTIDQFDQLLRDNREQITSVIYTDYLSKRAKEGITPMKFVDFFLSDVCNSIGYSNSFTAPVVTSIIIYGVKTIEEIEEIVTSDEVSLLSVIDNVFGREFNYSEDYIQASLFSALEVSTRRVEEITKLYLDHGYSCEQILNACRTKAMITASRDRLSYYYFHFPGSFNDESLTSRMFANVAVSILNACNKTIGELNYNLIDTPKRSYMRLGGENV